MPDITPSGPLIRHSGAGRAAFRPAVFVFVVALHLGPAVRFMMLAKPEARVANRLGLSASPAWKRVQELEKAGVITGRVAQLDHGKVGLALTVLVANAAMGPSV